MDTTRCDAWHPVSQDPDIQRKLLTFVDVIDDTSDYTRFVVAFGLTPPEAPEGVVVHACLAFRHDHRTVVWDARDDDGQCLLLACQQQGGT